MEISGQTAMQTSFSFGSLGQSYSYRSRQTWLNIQDARSDLQICYDAKLSLESPRESLENPKES